MLHPICLFKVPQNQLEVATMNPESSQFKRMQLKASLVDLCDTSDQVGC